MSAVQYPFIDIAVHERVRERFARGEALVLFSADLTRVLWANGEGAAIFGNPSIYDFLEEGPAQADVTFRQMESTARQLAVTGDARKLMVRIGNRFQRIPTQATVELIETSRGEAAVLFAAPAADGPTSSDCAKRMLEGFDDPDIHMAVLSADGSILAASKQFSALGLLPSTARMLVDSVEHEADRLVKRPILTSKGYLPAAIGRLTDAPALHLLFAIETIIGNLDPVSSAETAPEKAAALPPSAKAEIAAAEASKSPLAREESLSAAYDRALDAVVGIADIEEPGDAGSQVAADLILDRADELAADVEAEIRAGQPSVHSKAGGERSPASPVPGRKIDDRKTIRSDFVFSPNGRAIRFVWKIDADGRFCEVSDEFAQAVGPNAADVNGHAFGEIAALFDLDPDGKIAESLGKRDTWSGRTIYWPVEGTTLQVPVDLAALPTYTRDRAFDGFRGFGIVRVADAIEDPRHLGLALGLDEDAAEPVSASVEREDIPTEKLAPVETAPSASEIAAEPDVPAPVTGGTQVIKDEPAEPLIEEAPASLLDQMFGEDGKEHAGDAPPVGEPAPTSPAPAEGKMEPPALGPSEPPAPADTDKVVHLPDRRTRDRDGLTPVEQAAFREIARRLETFGKRAEPPVTAAATAASDAAVTKEPQPAAAGKDEDTLPGTSSPAEPPESTTAQLELLQSLVPARNRTADGLTPEIVDQMPVALLIHSGDKLIHGNPEFMRLTGYDDLEQLQKLGGLDALLQRQDLVDKAEAAGGMMVVRADDTVVPVSARLQSIRWEQGSALMLALMPVDHGQAGELPQSSNDNAPDTKTEDDDSRARLQVEVEELRSILETATDGVVIIGDDGLIRALNRSASALFNYDIEEARDKPFVMLFAHESQRAVADYLNGLAGHGVASVLNDGREVIGRESSGGFIPLFMTMGHLTASSGYCAVIRDITQWKRTEEELLNAKRAAETANAHKSDFLARVSHEIRTPLNAIIGFSDMMATERFGPIGHPRYVEYSNDIGRSGRHVLDIVNDLLDISKIEAGEMDLDFVAVGLNEAISEAVALVQPQANGQRVIIRTALSQSVPQVVADLRSIKQIALNVLANAIRFTPSGGQIVVSTAYETNGSVVLRIRDTGIGMTRAELEQAMKPFRQVTTGTRKRDDGTGLGLPLTKAMVDANRAIFSITSAPNDGTLVEITFPSPRVLAD
ncbi:PAS domain S-box protein [Rhizobiaceae bacterium n13]|uniref:histidine kinase n=1 Tax=Ferirhizobium litorale TaxID=2927786 RepID=A0AAE3U3D5_9HYPH|nr:ATP-binding protein [Fererhizobium litorale]MDI7863465.1 PAS domain S-box protein [Fererhizobium litorale]MDI7922258.1 PAS domain S-box protein [Fererhizobium litorale]